MATLEIINVGSTANDGTGDPLRVAFEKVNNNFSNIWSTGYNSMESITSGNTTQSIFTWPANAFTQASFQIYSSDNDSTNSQSIVINASINGALDAVKFTGHSTIFHGDAVTNYDMAVIDGNVTMYATPFVEGQMRHYIVYQVTYDELIMGSSLVTQDLGFNLLTETTDSILTTEG